MKKKEILDNLYYICATCHSIAGRKNVYTLICKLIYDMTGNENYNPDKPNWQKEPNELIRMTKQLRCILDDED